MDARGEHRALVDDLSRRAFLQRAGILGLGALVASAGPVARAVLAPETAEALVPVLADATLQAFADTIIPGRRATRTDLGNPIDSRAIAGVDNRPGAVETDALPLYRHPKVGFDALEPAFLAELEQRSLPLGGPFLTLPFDRRVQAVRGGTSFDNETRILWEAAAAVPFTAFAGGIAPEQTARRASGYRVMGHPGAAPRGYRKFSYGRKLAKERTKRGNLR